MNEYLKNTDIDYTDTAVYIPEVMNAMFNEQAADALHRFEIRNAFRIKMMQSKSWLFQKFNQEPIGKNTTILVVGGWLGFTSFVLSKNGFNNITEIDIDLRLQNFSKHLNRFNNSFRHRAVDVNNIDVAAFDIIINTSCEHIIDNSWYDKIKSNTLLVLQSNNIDVPDHINKCYAIEEMIDKYPMQIQYSGTLDYQDGTKRFMLIGTK